ncbi:hypothetical protein [Pseudomonas izuensis]|uniref:DUF4352 domain-containing protein n=1 Tax=Pseudomonas izuensis TaxID=2684212 RepID=A0ABM7RV72_9PSED|nr:hypothetical protein [Pseudomonas izuensis]BCX68761.1 hypothetical protein LAB08_R34030 [Pseudomonas izuensis]
MSFNSRWLVRGDVCSQIPKLEKPRNQAMNEEPGSKGWWQTIPGILTATAGIITAIAALIVALNQAGFFETQPKKATQVPNGTVTQATGGESRADTTAKAPMPSSIEETKPYPITLSSGAEVRVGDAVYKILSARLDRHSPSKLSLRFEVRMTNNDRYDANFWAASFRLLIGGVLRAPENDLNELVASHSSKEGSVEFVIPDNVTDVGLQIGEVGNDAPVLQIDLRAPH